MICAALPADHLQRDAQAGLGLPRGQSCSPLQIAGRAGQFHVSGMGR